MHDRLTPSTIIELTLTSLKLENYGEKYGKKMDTMTAYIKKENYINFLNIVKEFSCHES